MIKTPMQAEKSNNLPLLLKPFKSLKSRHGPKKFSV